MTLVEADRRVTDDEEQLFVEFASQATHRPQAQSYWNRWLVVSLLSLGRPGTSRATGARSSSGLRSAGAAEVLRGFLNEVEPLKRERAGLAWPDLQGLGVELPDDLRARFTSART